MQSTSYETPNWMRLSQNQDCREKYQHPHIGRWHHPNGRKKTGTKESLDKGERRDWKCWPKTQHSKNWGRGIWPHHFLTNRRRKVEAVADFLCSSSQITVDCVRSHEIKRCLLLGRKAVSNLNSVLKSRDIILPTKVHLVKAMDFPVVMYRCKLDHKEGWALKSWCFWTVVLEKPPESHGLQGDQTTQS